MSKVLSLSEVELSGKRVLIREDLNVPVNDAGDITNTKRLDASLPTIIAAKEAGAAVMIMSHLGRPTEGEYEDKYSLKPVADFLSNALGTTVRLEKEWLDGVEAEAGEVVLLENVRFNKGEKKNADELSKKMAALCDVYVMDAFGTAHRAQASTHGVAKFAPVSVAGPLLKAELDALGKALGKPEKPMVAIVGGSKVSTKLDVLDALKEKCDQIIVGGGIANTFLAAAGKPIGKSLYEADFIETAKQLMTKVDIPLPVDVVVAKEFSIEAEAVIKSVDNVADDEMILDVGPETSKMLAAHLTKSKTILWNGPLGVFEFPQFAEGTKSLAEAIAESAAFSIAGGGDTVAAIDVFNIQDKISYISTGGGAFLEFVEGKTLPAVEALEAAAKS